MSSKANPGRRKFMAALGLGGAAAATAVLTGAGKEAKDVSKADAPERKGYRETAHVREYYRTARV
ncbi:MAG: twin-arginine translocation signal domain-containing protein [Pseudomonadota bacterium]